MYSCSCNHDFARSPQVAENNFKPINKDFIYTYNSNIQLTRDNETLIPKHFWIRVPCNIKYYESINSSDFGFYYRGKQIIFIKIDLENKMPVADTIYQPTREQILEVLDHAQTSNDRRYNLIEIPVLDNRKHIIMQRGTATILLVNIYPKKLDSFLEGIQQFQFIE